MVIVDRCRLCTMALARTKVDQRTLVYHFSLFLCDIGGPKSAVFVFRPGIDSATVESTEILPVSDMSNRIGMSHVPRVQFLPGAVDHSF